MVVFIEGIVVYSGMTIAGVSLVVLHDHMGPLSLCLAGLGLAAQVEDDLDQRLPFGQGPDRLHDLRWQRREEDVEIVRCCLLPLVGSHPG